MNSRAFFEKRARHEPRRRGVFAIGEHAAPVSTDRFALFSAEHVEELPERMSWHRRSASGRVARLDH